MYIICCRPATQDFEPTPIPSNRNSVNSQIIEEEKVFFFSLIAR